MPVLDNKIDNFVSREIAAAQALLVALSTWRELRKEYDASGYNGAITDADMAGSSNQHVSAADLADAFTSHAAIENLLSDGHYSNFYALVP